LLRNSQILPDVSIEEGLSDHEMELNDLKTKLNRLSMQEDLIKRGGHQIEKLVEDFSEGLKSLQDAIQKRDIHELEVVLKPIKHLLATKPTQINSRLTEAARTLPLVHLRDALFDICQNLDQSHARQETLSRFKNGVDAIETLSGKLLGLIEDHDCWQQIDNQLRSLEGSISQKLDDIFESWQYLKEDTNTQLHNKIEDWVKDITKYSDRLNEAIEQQDSSMIRQHFKSYRSRIGQQFFVVDLTLKNLCGELRQVCEPLILILELM
jgi:DNA repair exonuclease SbcCD ATPase subunit